MSDTVPIFHGRDRVRIMDTPRMRRLKLANKHGVITVIHPDGTYGVQMDCGDFVCVPGDTLMRITLEQEARWKAAKETPT